jgi:hypothetical protein
VVIVQDLWGRDGGGCPETSTKQTESTDVGFEVLTAVVIEFHLLGYNAV